MKISFILPGLIKIPIGGVKIIYRYAEEISRLGHMVYIISPRKESNQIHHLLKAGAIKTRDYYHRVKNKPYYKTPSGVEHHIVPLPIMKYIPDGDAIIATSWLTANWVNSYSAKKGKKFYFIQNHETYLGNEKIINYTWKLPLIKIVIAQWLKDVAEKMGEIANGPIPNAIDPKEFYITNPIENRQLKISMLYHRLTIKGARDGMLVLEKVKESNPNLQATVFASRKPHIAIPAWVLLEIRPNTEKLREIYNTSAIFLHPSQREGWPLPPAESMMCGCTVVAAENSGIKEYITHNESGLLAQIGNVEAMAEHIQYLLDNPGKRIFIAKQGQETINRFSWEKSAKQFEKILIKEV